MTVDFTDSISDSISDSSHEYEFEKSQMWICQNFRLHQNTFLIVFQIECKPLGDIKNILSLVFQMQKYFLKLEVGQNYEIFC